MVLGLLFGLPSLLLTSALWKQTDKWWQRAIVFAFCYFGLVVAACATAYFVGR